MKLIYAFLVLLLMALSVTGYTSIVRDARDPDHLDKCYDKTFKKYYSVGNNRVEGKCERAHCSLNDYELTITG